MSHLSGIVGANVKVTLEIEAEIPNGAPDNVVRTVTENSRTLKFTSQGFAVVLSEIFGNVLVSEDDSLKSVRSQANSVGRLRDN